MHKWSAPRVAVAMPSLRPLAADATPEAVSAAIQANGAVIIDGLIGPAKVDDIMAELGPHIEAIPPGRDDFTGAHATRTGARWSPARPRRANG
jgi:hypothetical protein